MSWAAILVSLWLVVGALIVWRGGSTRPDLSTGRVVACAVIWPVVVIAAGIERAVNWALGE